MGGKFSVLHLVRPFCRFLPEVQRPLKKVPFRKKMRGILASSRDTVMELGVAPIITSGMVMQLLTGANIIKVDSKVREDRELLNAAQKFLAILIALGEAAANVMLGTYSDIGLLGVGNAFFIIFQLCFAIIVFLYLDELLQKGHDLGFAISLFTATNIW